MAKNPSPAAGTNLPQGTRVPGRAHFVPIVDDSHEAPQNLEHEDAKRGGAAPPTVS